MRDYELVLVVSPEGGEEGFPATVERVHSLIQERGGKINNADAWGRRRLAYQINRYNEGYYNITHFEIDPPELREIENNIDLADDVLRHLVVRLEEAPEPQAPVEAAVAAEPEAATAEPATPAAEPAAASAEAEAPAPKPEAAAAEPEAAAAEPEAAAAEPEAVAAEPEAVAAEPTATPSEPAAASEPAVAAEPETEEPESADTVAKEPS